MGITVGPDSNLWVSTAIGVRRIPPNDPANSTAFDVGIANGAGITTGPDNRLWVVGGQDLVRFDPADPENTDDANLITGMSGKGMATGSDGLLWIADGSGRIISATADTNPVITPYPVGGGPQDVAAGLNGQVAYANPLDSPHEVGLISPGGSPQQIPLQTSDPFGVAFGADGAYWVARSSTDDLLRLAPDGTTTTLTGFSNAANVGPRKIAAGPNGTLWVTLDDQEKVARVTGVEPPTGDGGGGGGGGGGETTIDKGPKRKIKTRRKKAKVRFKFSSPEPTASFECALKRPRKQAGKAPATFKRCSSPRSYRLKPGKYTFQVRATIGGIPDETPARRQFKIVRVHD